MQWMEARDALRHVRGHHKSDGKAEHMQALAVNRAVNSVKNDNEECIQPIGEPLL
jgi:putative SOS response-associated peptidase YedK